MATRRRLRRVVALAALGGTVALPAQTLAATESCRFGVNAHQAPNGALDLAAAAGIGWVRFDMNWFQFEPQKGQYDWTEADRFFDHAKSLGLHVFVTVAYSPSWAVPQPCNQADPNPVNQCHNRPPVKISDWTEFVTAAVARYQDRVTHWGMWNEPNLDQFFSGSRPEYVDKLLKPGSDAVHAACPGCKVLGPELANLRGAHWDSKEGQCLGGECIFNGWNYSLQKVLEAAGGYIDIVTHHRYQDPAADLFKALADGEVQVIKIMYGLKELTDQYAPGKDVWLTEFGWEAEPFGKHKNGYAAGQLQSSFQSFDELQQGKLAGAVNQPWPLLKKLFWYDLTDDPNGYSWGLLDDSGNTKPQYDAYKAVIQSLGPCVEGSGGGGAGPGGAGPGGGGQGAGSPGGGGQGAGDQGGATSSGGGSIGAGGSTGAGASSAGGSAAGQTESGCGCRVAGQDRQRPEWLVLALAIAALRRRRPRR